MLRVFRRAGIIRPRTRTKHPSLVDGWEGCDLLHGMLSHSKTRGQTMTDLYPAKQQAWDWVETNRSQMSSFHMEIWRYAETAWREYKSACAWLFRNLDTPIMPGLRTRWAEFQTASTRECSWRARPSPQPSWTYSPSLRSWGRPRQNSTNAPEAAIGGTQWVAPLLPKDFKPPVDLRWPEYIETERGQEWWIPTPV